jgi:UDPglucose 6-dehydrogenase
MRESPALDICKGLVQKDAMLRVWDPAAMKEAEWYLESIKDKVYFAGDEYDAAAGAHAVVIITPWNQFRNLDLLRIKKLLALPCFFDLRNIYKRDEVEGLGLKYFGVGK